MLSSQLFGFEIVRYSLIALMKKPLYFIPSFNLPESTVLPHPILWSFIDYKFDLVIKDYLSIWRWYDAGNTFCRLCNQWFKCVHDL